MFANSSLVVSSQLGIHPQLERVVRRHLDSQFQRPISSTGNRSFDLVSDWLRAMLGRSLILDSGCGTGWSARRLAEKYSDAAVLGADRSGVRLARSAGAASTDVHVAGNLCLARTNLEDLWPQLLRFGVRVERHFLFYPNPSPKPWQLKRRWHAHPLFPVILALGGTLELRSNWKTYVDEFARALELAGRSTVVNSIGPSEPAVSPFEIKYRASGHDLWRLTCDLG